MFDCTISVENGGKNNEKPLVFKKITKKQHMNQKKLLKNYPQPIHVPDCG